jgi:hypothetical protein
MIRRLALAWLSCLAGCASDGVGHVPTACSSDAQCGSGAVCMNGACVGFEPGELSLHFEVQPPAASGYVETQILAQQVNAGAEEIELVLPRPTSFESVTVLDRDRNPTAALLSVRGIDRIPGRSLDTTISLTSARPTSISLVPGPYEVKILPIDAQTPGIEVERWDVRASDLPQRREFELPSEYRLLTGQVVSRTASNLKFENVEVSATSVPGGLPSTRALTGPDGTFSIELPSSTEVTFLLQASRKDTTAPVWGYEQLVTVPNASREINVRLEDTSTAAFGLAQVQVLGIGNGAPQVVSGAKLTFTASSSLDFRVFRAVAQTNQDGYAVTRSANGEVPLLLLDADYLVEVVPPPESAFARTRSRIRRGQIGPGLVLDAQIALDPKPIASGRIVSASGAVVPQADLELEPLDAGGRQFTSRTDSAGAFAVALDPGRYRLRADPGAAPANEELLPVGFMELEVPADRPEIDLGAIILEPGTLLVGRVLGETPIEGAEVEVFRADGGRALSLGRVRTEAAGRFRLVVPRPD